MRFRQSIRAVAVVAVAAGALVFSGCTSGEAAGPSPASDPLPTAAPAADPAVAGVVIGGRAFSTVDADGAVVDTVEYSGDPEAAMGVLSDAFGAAPELKHQESDNNCVPAAWIAVWDDVVHLTYDTSGLPAGQAFAVTTTSAAVNDVPVTTPGGVAVGGSLTDLETSVPGVHSVHHDYEGVAFDFVHYDVGAGEWVDPNSDAAMSGEYWGARADVNGGVITRLSAPGWYFDAC